MLMMMMIMIQSTANIAFGQTVLHNKVKPLMTFPGMKDICNCYCLVQNDSNKHPFLLQSDILCTFRLFICC